MIYTVEQDAIPDLIRELHQKLTAKDSLYAQTTAKLLYVYAHHQSSRVDSASTLFSIQLDNRLALKKISRPVGQADFCRAFHYLSGKPLAQGLSFARPIHQPYTALVLGWLQGFNTKRMESYGTTVNPSTPSDLYGSRQRTIKRDVVTNQAALSKGLIVLPKGS